MPQDYRPYLKFRINELEDLVQKNSARSEVLLEIAEELENRTTARAVRLSERVEKLLGESQLAHFSTEASETTVSGAEGGSTGRELDGNDESEEQATRTPTTLPPLTNKPEDVLSAWIALEVLSPPTFLRPEQLAGGDRRCIARLDGNSLPWEGKGERSRPKNRLYYQIVLGSVAMPVAVDDLLKVFRDGRDERPGARGEAVLATLLVNRQGIPVDTPFAAVSSFAWGVPLALSGDLVGLGQWPEAETDLLEQLEKRVRRQDKEGNALPIDAKTISTAYQWLIQRLRLPERFVRPPSFAIRTYQYFQSYDPPESILLNSFFLRDLGNSRSDFRAGTAPATLRRFLGVDRPPRQVDLLDEAAPLREAVLPAKMPPARWPSPGRHGLSLLQQAAVNLAGPVTKENSLLAVNGPPGTGKTTLLRDIVATQVTERAVAMASFADPEEAFEFGQQRLRAGSAWIPLYKLSKKLKGHEILIASSNNKAVENVSAELPTSKAVAADSGLRYFKVLADNLLEQDCWGVGAAVLGNAMNRARFRQRFWWDDDFGLATYLINATGTERLTEPQEDEDGERTPSRKPLIVTEENAPKDKVAALARWTYAKRQFDHALTKSKTMLGEVQKLATAIDQLPELDAKRAIICTAVDATAKLAEHWESRPGFWARLFGSRAFKSWKLAGERLIQDSRAALQTIGLAETAVAALSLKTNAPSEIAHRAARERLEKLDVDLVAIRETVAQARKQLGRRVVDRAFFEMEHAERHKISPWLTDKQNRIRDDLFVAAMDLHKAFIDAAAKPLRHNLNAFMNCLGGRSLGNAEKDAFIPDLWASLFLVVPAISTTFASVDRMLARLPNSSLGWLLIDEAGQAIPQAAVGALARVRQALIVGDPMQIEPVVMLPESLTATLCRQFGIDPDKYNAPAASVQTLADTASPFAAEFQSRVGSRTVGVPLLVHRRCVEPMFGISNAIAYERLMVDGTPKRSSPIREVLGPSRWIDVEGGDEEKWCPEEGVKVCDALSRLRQSDVSPDLYIVTPFVSVQDSLRRVVRDSRVLEGWIEDHEKWIRERIGTVHTVQGREAEAVLFVLGAQSPQRAGARGWAGGRPNLLNVAVTRAKEALYVIGRRELWKEAGVFRELNAQLPH